MIDEHKEEQASLYVLGVLTPNEKLSFEAALIVDAELRNLVSALQTSRDALVASVSEAAPSPELKKRIFAQIETQQKVIPFPVREERQFSGANLWLPWALAACLAIICAVSWAHENQLRYKVAEQAQHLSSLTQMADSLRSATQDLQQAVMTLRETNRLDNLRIAMLKSQLKDLPNAVAVSLWDEGQQRGVFVVQNLKPLPVDKDYQLWVIDPKYPVPVNAGVFQVDAQGNVRVQFKADKLIESASKFAVTQEPKGGQLAPTLKNLVLIGG